MILDIVYFLFLLLMVVSRWRNWCSGCEGNKWLDIFQILFTGISAHIVFGATNIIKLINIVLLSFIIKAILGLMIKKKENKDIKTELKKCKSSNCTDPWV